MTLEQLQHIFRFQTTEDEDFKPTGKLNYILFDGRSQTNGSVPAEDIVKLPELLKNYEHEGYRDRTPLFINPTAEL